MPHDKAFDIYGWELEFATETLRQDDHRYSIDPQNPPSQFGPAKIIRMVPRQSGYPPFAVVIPKGALPVWHRKVTRDMSTYNLKGLQFRIGWRKTDRDREGNLRSVRVMTAIDVQTMVVSLVCDGKINPSSTKGDN